MTSFEFIPNHARIILDAVPSQLCEKTVKQFTRTGRFSPCKYNGNINKNYRDCSEIKIEDTILIAQFWRHIQNYIPSSCDGQKLVGLHYSRVYLLRYSKGQYFKKHYDGYSINSQGHKSRITVLLYLNDLESDGVTRFYAEPNNGIQFVEPYQNSAFYDINPKVGTMAIFTHQLLHEGMPIKNGYKYCMRFNVLYTNDNPNDNPTNNNKTDFTIPAAYNFNNNGNKNNNNKLITYEETEKFNNPEPNGLKYKRAKMEINGEMVTITKSLKNQNSQKRWMEVASVPHVFNIKRADFPGFIDTTMGRPPTKEEDFCPNCYEILSLNVTYKNCSGCNYPVLSIDEERRRYNLSI